jgi:hypothetical protein
MKPQPGKPAAPTSPVRRLPDGDQAVITRLTYSTEWTSSAVPAFSKFRRWAGEYIATPPERRDRLLREGLKAADQRRAALAALMVRDPRAALAAAVPAALIARLPPALRALLERRVAGYGVLHVAGAMPPRGKTKAGDAVIRLVRMNDAVYRAHTYGDAHMYALDDAPLHGIALGHLLALHESPVRLLEPDERSLGAGFDGGVAAQVGDELHRLGSLRDALALEQALLRDPQFGRRELREQRTPRIPVGKPRNAAMDRERLKGAIHALHGEEVGGATFDATRTTGAHRVLLVRIDFPDAPGEPLSFADADRLLNVAGREYFDECSQNRFQLSGEVAQYVYRMPRTAQHYATSAGETGLDLMVAHLPQAIAVGAPPAPSHPAGPRYFQHDYDAGQLAGTYWTLIIAFRSLAGIEGSHLTRGGWADIGGRLSWLNGQFDQAIISHELGHNLGLRHANRWNAQDNTVVGAGGSDEYGDPFDAMGSGGNGTHYHYNPWYKHLLHWLPASDVHTVTTDGTHRVFRFDHRDSAGARALRIPRGDGRSYWVGLRQGFADSASVFNGAYVVWSRDAGPASSLMLDMTPVTEFAADGGLPVGRTFVDPVHHLEISVLAKGGSAPQEYLDVRVRWPQGPYLLQDLEDVTAYAGEPATFSVRAGGVRQPLSYRWSRDGSAVAGTAEDLRLESVTSASSGSYTVVVTDAGGASVQSSARLAVVDGPPVFTRQPVSEINVSRTGSLTLTVSVRGSPEIELQWWHNDTQIPGATAATYELSNAEDDDAGEYKVLARNGFGETWSEPCLVRVYYERPFVSLISRRRTRVLIGGTVKLSAQIVGTGRITRSWYKGEQPVQPGAEGERNDTLEITSARVEDSGVYTLRAVNNLGDEARTPPFFVEVVPTTLAVGWGDDSFGQRNPLPGVEGLIDIAAGARCSAAVRATGTVDFWGDAGAVDLYALDGVRDAIAVTVAGPYGVALRATGSIRYWRGAPPPYPPGGTIGVASSSSHVMYVNVGLGPSADGAPGLEALQLPPSSLDWYQIVEAAAGAGHSLALHADGTVTHWGRNPPSRAVPEGLDRVMAIAAGDDHALALRDDGTVVAWGANDAGQCDVPPGLADVTAISAGARHSLALRRDGRVVAWGANDAGQCDVPAWLGDVVAIAAGERHSLALTTGAVPPRFIVRPQSAAISVGDRLTLLGIATGTRPLQYDWYRDDRLVQSRADQEGGPWYSVPSASAETAGRYVLVVRNAAGTASSDPVVVSLSYAPAYIQFGPVDRTAVAGQHAELVVQASGSPSLTYAWYKDDRPDPLPESGPRLVFPAVRPEDAGRYYVVVSNAAGHNARSPTAILTVLLPARITAHPANTRVEIGRRLELRVQAAGTSPLYYQWRRNGQDLANETRAVYVVPAAGPQTDGSYVVRVWNDLSEEISRSAVVTTYRVAPSIVVQPRGKLVQPGQAFTFSVTAAGTPPLTYRWFQERRTETGSLVVFTRGTSRDLVIQNAGANDTGDYWVEVRNEAGSTLSERARLVVVVPAPPRITRQPQSQRVEIGRGAIFTVEAASVGPMTFQWYRAGSAISGATASTYTIPNVGSQHAGAYHAVVTNAVGSTRSETATLTTRPAT